MIRINNITSIELELFLKFLSHYLEVLEYNSAINENNLIRKSIVKVLIKDVRKKIEKIHPFQNIVWQLHEHQSIAFQNAILSYKASALANIEDKIKVTRILLNINHLSKITYGKVS